MDAVEIACLLRGFEHPDSKRLRESKATLEEIWSVIAKEFEEKGMEQQAYTIIGYNPKHFAKIFDYFPQIFKALIKSGFFRIVNKTRVGRKAIADVTIEDEHWSNLFLSEPEDIYIAYKLGARTTEELGKLARSINYLRKRHTDLPHFWREYGDIDKAVTKIKKLFDEYKKKYERKKKIPPALKSGIIALRLISERISSVPEGWKEICDVKKIDELIDILCKLSLDYTNYRNSLISGVNAEIITDFAKEDIAVIEEVLNANILSFDEVLSRTTLLLNIINDFIKDALIKIREGFDLEDIRDVIYSKFYDLPDFRFIGFGKLL